MSEARENILILLGVLAAVALMAFGPQLLWGTNALYRDWRPDELAKHSKKPVLACNQQEFWPGWTEIQAKGGLSAPGAVPTEHIYDKPKCSCLCPPDAHEGKIAWSDSGWTASCSCEAI